jgi:hypothetical protein
MKSDSRTKIVSEWEENFFFDNDDPDFVVGGGLSGPGAPNHTPTTPIAVPVPVVPVASKLLFSEQISCSPRNRRIQIKGKWIVCLIYFLGRFPIVAQLPGLVRISLNCWFFADFVERSRVTWFDFFCGFLNGRAFIFTGKVSRLRTPNFSFYLFV